MAASGPGYSWSCAAVVVRYPNGQEVNETMAAPTKRTTPRIKKLLDAVRLGQPYMRAAQVAGIDYETFRPWRSESRSFAESLEAATAEGELHVLGSLRQASNDGSVAAPLGLPQPPLPHDWVRGGRLKHEMSG